MARVRTIDIDSHYGRVLSLKPMGERPAGTLGPATVKRLHAIISGSLKWATRMGWIAQNPASNCSPIPDVRPNRAAAGPAEFRAALEVPEDRHVGLRAKILFMGTTGCRKSEALALRWSSLDGESALISESFACVPGQPPFVKDTKTHQGRRVSIGANVLAELNRLRLLQHENCLAAGVPFDPEGWGGQRTASADDCFAQTRSALAGSAQPRSLSTASPPEVH